MIDCMIDSGNSRVKFAARHQDQWRFLAAVDFEHPKFIEQCLQVLQSQAFAQIYLASVSKGSRLEKLEQFLQRITLPVLRIETLSHLGTLKIAYLEPKQLGVDRFLALLAASETSLPCIIISFGSALTVDVMSADGKHQGGLIAPSPEFQWRSMHEHFPGIFNAPGLAMGLARNTADALTSGIELQTVSMLERVIAQNAKSENTRIIVCGGGAEQWSEKLPFKCQYMPDLIFQGMHRYIALIHS